MLHPESEKLLPHNKRIARAFVHLMKKSMGIDELKIAFVNRIHFIALDVTAAFDPDTNTIIVNEGWLSGADGFRIALTISHDSRRAYQLAEINVTDPTENKEPPKRVKKWKKEFNDYMFPTDDPYDLSCIKQDIEIDAIAFSNLITMEIFHGYGLIPVCIEKRVHKRIEEIRKTLKEMGTYDLLSIPIDKHVWL